MRSFLQCRPAITGSISGFRCFGLPSMAEGSASSNSAETNVDRDSFRPVIGLEVHAQITAKSKLFSRAASNYWASSNTTVSFFDCALPGTLPVLNQRCVEAAILTSLALSCRINLISMFDRKHYFYSDLPAGYQITQQRQPIAVDGWVEYIVDDERSRAAPYVKRTKITQVQLEQDSGKSIHDTANARSLVDLNRAGIALLEIVCDHNLESEAEAACFAKELHSILRKIGVCEGRMERGQFRVDANISVHRPGEPLGPRTEVKNLNSFRFIHRALNYEIGRQIELKKAGKEVVNETLAFDFRIGKTSSMRDKEIRQDYRYMPEPNLPPLVLDDSSLPNQDSKRPKGAMDIHELRNQLPVLPLAMRAKWMQELGLTLADCVIMTGNDNIARSFDEVMSKEGMQPVRTLRAIVLYADALSSAKTPWELSPIDLPKLIEMVRLLQEDRISEAVYLQIFEAMLKGDKRAPSAIIQALDLFAPEDDTELDRMCDQVIAHSSYKIRKFAAGDKNRAIRHLLKAAGTRLKWRYPEWKMEKCFREKMSK